MRGTFCRDAGKPGVAKTVALAAAIAHANANAHFLPKMPSSPEKPRILSVTEITRTVRDLIEGVLGEVWVEGEVCNLRKQSSGHQYFTLKDDRCQLPCVLFFRPGLRHASIPLSDGMLVHVRGQMTVYEARGQYQLNVSLVQAAGAGLLAARFEALKRKLADEGLFEAARKRGIPRFPRAIGIVTSPTGAAIQDMLNILHRRAPWVRILINPVRVQGAGAAAEIAAAIDELNEAEEIAGELDVIVVARGGGSTEDLWEFNEEAVARAIFRSRLPVVSAVGHEIDFTIADFVADLRAPTPSAAAELVVPDSVELAHRLDGLGAALERVARETVERWKAHLAFILRSVLFREPKARLDALAQDLDDAEERLKRATRAQLALSAQQVATLRSSLREHRPDHLIALRSQQLEQLAEHLTRLARQQREAMAQRLEHGANLLRILGPQATLSRGYSITRTAAGELVHSAGQVRPGTEVVTQLAEGRITSTVTGGGGTH